jgi:hypothetical protein
MLALLLLSVSSLIDCILLSTVANQQISISIAGKMPIHSRDAGLHTFNSTILTSQCSSILSQWTAQHLLIILASIGSDTDCDGK